MSYRLQAESKRYIYGVGMIFVKLKFENQIFSLGGFALSDYLLISLGSLGLSFEYHLIILETFRNHQKLAVAPNFRQVPQRPGLHVQSNYPLRSKLLPAIPVLYTPQRAR